MPIVGDDIIVNIGTAEEPIIRPGVIVRVWSEACVNAQVFLDGLNDERAMIALGIDEPPMCIWWATSIGFGAGRGQWRHN